MSIANASAAASALRVSVIIPMFNCAKYIVQCLRSVAEQTYSNLEAILVDDCSSDGTLEACREVLGSDARFRLIRLPDNRGPAAARNAGIDAATGEFLLFLDADDWLTTDALQLFMAAQAKHGAAFVVSAFDKHQPPPRGVERISHFPEDRSLDRQALSEYAVRYMNEPGKFMMFSYCWGRLYSAEVIRKQALRFPSDLRICEDVLFNFEYLRHVEGLSYIFAPTYNYRFGNPDSAAMVFIREGGEPLHFYRDIWTAYSGILSFIETFGRKSDLPEARRITRLGHISHAIPLLIRASGTSPSRPLYHLIRAMLHDPVVAENLGFYEPRPGQSRLLPRLLRKRLVVPTMLLCKYKYRQRYDQKRAR